MEMGAVSHDLPELVPVSGPEYQRCQDGSRGVGEWLEVCLRESWSGPDLQKLLESFFFFKLQWSLFQVPCTRMT